MFLMRSCYAIMILTDWLAFFNEIWLTRSANKFFHIFFVDVVAKFFTDVLHVWENCINGDEAYLDKINDRIIDLTKNSICFVACVQLHEFSWFQNYMKWLTILNQHTHVQNSFFRLIVIFIHHNIQHKTAI